jgi:hypothetical protein|tara:strand:+ start:4386 stop:7061 length:2676 start_codon:yes stop_codon:yes gene_type:complete
MIIQNENSIELNFNYSESQKEILESLKEDGLIYSYGNFYEIPNENYYQLDYFYKKWIGLPEEFSGTAKVRLHGPGLLFDESCLLVDYYDELGSLISVSKDGFFLKGDSKIEYEIPQEISETLNLVSEYNSLPNKKKDNSGFAKFGQLKKSCKSDMLILDDLLKNQEVIYPENIKINVEIDGEKIIVSPTILGEDEFTSQFEKRTKVKEHYNYRDSNGVKKRVLFDNENINVHKELEKIKGKSTFEGKELKALVDFPGTYFNPDLTDVSALFGERVLGLQVFTPPSIPVVNQINSNWVPGFKISDEFIFVNDIYEYNLLKNSYKIALEGETNSVYFKGKTFGLDSVKSVLRISKLIFKEETEISEHDLEQEFKEFLIVKDNLEELSFTSTREEEIIKNYELLNSKKFNHEFQLKEHQVEGIAWLQATFFQLKAPGVLLADDMGLGKTLQILYFLESIADQVSNQIKPCLIVCPSSLIENWMQEYDRFFPKQSYEKTILKGKVLPYLNMLRSGENIDTSAICITTYETMRLNAVGFCTVDWGIVVLDEAQKIKNPAALVTHSAKGLKSQFKIAMTGTPVENSLLDLWCLMDFCVPGILGSAKLFNRNVQSEELNSEKIREIIQNKFLRRLKLDVAKDLPKKHEHIIRKKFIGKQLELYMNVINHLSYLKENDLLKGAAMLAAMHEMKSIADHAELVRSDNDLDLSTIADATKVQISLGLLQNIKVKNEKVIIFTERRKMQFILKQTIKKEFNISADIVNGDIPSTSNYNDSKMTRQKLVDKFQSIEGFNIIIMSPVAAGFGLNVVGANHVIHYSRHWNPAKEQQATDRVYRIGQTKDVHIYYPIATLSDGKPSFDEILNDRLILKKKLSDDIMFPSEEIVVSNMDILNDLMRS